MLIKIIVKKKIFPDEIVHKIQNCDKNLKIWKFYNWFQWKFVWKFFKINDFSCKTTYDDTFVTNCTYLNRTKKDKYKENSWSNVKDSIKSLDRWHGNVVSSKISQSPRREKAQNSVKEQEISSIGKKGRKKWELLPFTMALSE